MKLRKPFLVTSVLVAIATMGALAGYRLSDRPTVAFPQFAAWAAGQDEADWANVGLASADWSEPSAAAGFPAAMNGGTYAYEAATTLADIEGNGEMEIVVGSRALSPDGSLGCQGRVYAYRADGTVKWEATVRAGVNSSPAVADINGDGVKDVVVGMGAWHDPEVKSEDRHTECGVDTPNNPSAPGNGGVVALDGNDGRELWVFNTQDWGEWGQGAGGEMANGVLDGVYSSPAIGDVTGDGNPEVVFGSWDNCIYLVDENGDPLWDRVPFDYGNPSEGLDFCGGHGFFNHDTVWSSPAVVDLTGDGKLEIIIGGDVSCDDINDPNRCNHYMEPNGGFLWVIRYDGEPLARRWFDQTIYSSPAVADLDQDGVLDIVVGTGQAFSNTGYYVTAWNLDTSRSLTEALVQKWRADVVGRTFSSPAIGDLDGNGVLDVVTIVKYGEWGVPAGPNFNNGSYVCAFRGNDGALMWQTHTCNNDAIGRSFPINASPILADIAGDDRPEVIFPHAWEVAVLNPDGTYYTQVNTSSGCTATSGSASYSGNGTFSAPVAVGDLTGDGTSEIVATGRWSEGSGSLQGAIYVWSSHPTGDNPWPIFHRDARHTGLYPRPAQLVVSPSSLTVLHQYGSGGTAQASLTIQNGGEEELAWEISSKPADVTVNPAYGTLRLDGVGSYMSRAMVTVATTGYTTGTYELGNIVITGMTGTDPVEGSPQSIPVTLCVGSVFDVYLPLTMR